MTGIADPGDNWSVARFAETADQYIQDILNRNKLSVLIGGTGLCLNAVIAERSIASGMSGGAVRRELERELEARGIEPLLAQLREVDSVRPGGSTPPTASGS